MKNYLLTCFLGLVCLVGSAQTVKVADSPPGTDLVYQPGFHGQESVSSSAQQEVLIYGEIINPDSLGPIIIKIAPYGFDNTIDVQHIDLSTTHGKFFDGVLDPRVRKFSAALPLGSEVAYFSLLVQDRPVLENFMITPGDSVKISIDLQRFQVVFGGSSGNWFETQYEIVRAQKQHLFDQPRYLYERDKEALLNQGTNRSQLEEANQQFGARLEIVEQGIDGLQRDVDLLQMESLQAIPGYKALNWRKNLIPESKYELLKSQLIGTYYGTSLNSVRRYGYGLARIRGDSLAMEKFFHEMPAILSNLHGLIADLATTKLTNGYLQFASQWARTMSIVEYNPFQSIVQEEFEGELRDRLLFDYTVERLNREKNPQAFLEDIIPHIQSNPWKRHLLELSSRFELHVRLQPVTLTSLSGELLQEDDFRGSPTLIYFYFSSCAASEGIFKNYLWPLYEELADEVGFKIVAVSVDNDPQLWKASIDTYSDRSLINANLPSKKWRSWLDYYLISAYPRVILLDAQGKILSLSMNGIKYAEFRARFLSLLQQEEAHEPFSILTTKN
jgi:hypothetical protein